MKGDMHLLGKAHEPLTISCEQCGTHLAYILGDAELSDGVVICPKCLQSLARWANR